MLCARRGLWTRLRPHHEVRLRHRSPESGSDHCAVTTASPSVEATSAHVRASRSTCGPRHSNVRRRRTERGSRDACRGTCAHSASRRRSARGRRSIVHARSIVGGWAGMDATCVTGTPNVAASSVESTSANVHSFPLAGSGLPRSRWSAGVVPLQASLALATGPHVAGRQSAPIRSAARSRARRCRRSAAPAGGAPRPDGGSARPERAPATALRGSGRFVRSSGWRTRIRKSVTVAPSSSNASLAHSACPVST